MALGRDLAAPPSGDDRHRGSPLLESRRRRSGGRPARPRPRPRPAPRGVRRFDPDDAARAPAGAAPARRCGGKLIEAVSRSDSNGSLTEGRDPHAVPYPRLLRQWRLGGGGGGALLLRQAGGGAVAGRGGVPGRAAARARGLRFVPTSVDAAIAAAPATSWPDAGRAARDRGGARRRGSRRRWSLAARHPPSSRAPHFVEHVLVHALIRERFRRRPSPTTLDGPLQQRARARGARPPGIHWRARHPPQAAGRRAPQPRRRRAGDGRLARLLRRARMRARSTSTTIRRRPGSTLKPFVYGAGAGGGDSPATLALRRRPPRRGPARELHRRGEAARWARYREALAGSYNLARYTPWSGSAFRRWSSACAKPA